MATLVQLIQPVRQLAPQLIAMRGLGEVYVQIRYYDRARQTLEELLEVSEHCGARGNLGMAHRLFGEVALATTLEQAPSHFEKAISIFRETKMENDLALAYSGMGRIANTSPVQ